MARESLVVPEVLGLLPFPEKMEGSGNFLGSWNRTCIIISLLNVPESANCAGGWSHTGVVRFPDQDLPVETGERLMRLSLAVVGVMIACLSLEPRSLAQQSCACAAGVGGSAAGPYIGASSSAPPQQVLLPYSYYAVAPTPARVYVPYGANDQFPFLGRAYGSPGDRWSWYSLGGGSSRYLARYYYPPLR
jgi:hypothetical protein